MDENDDEDCDGDSTWLRNECRACAQLSSPSPLKVHLDSVDVLTLLLHGVEVNMSHRVRSQRCWAELVPFLHQDFTHCWYQSRGRRLVRRRRAPRTTGQ